MSEYLICPECGNNSFKVSGTFNISVESFDLYNRQDDENISCASCRSHFKCAEYKQWPEPISIDNTEYKATVRQHSQVTNNPETLYRVKDAIQEIVEKSKPFFMAPENHDCIRCFMITVDAIRSKYSIDKSVFSYSNVYGNRSVFDQSTTILVNLLLENEFGKINISVKPFFLYISLI